MALFGHAAAQVPQDRRDHHQSEEHQCNGVRRHVAADFSFALSLFHDLGYGV